MCCVILQPDEALMPPVGLQCKHVRGGAAGRIDSFLCSARMIIKKEISSNITDHKDRLGHLRGVLVVEAIKQNIMRLLNILTRHIMMM